MAKQLYIWYNELSDNSEEASNMLEQYHDKYPIGQKLQDLKNNRAALNMLMNGKKTDPKQVKPKNPLKRKTVTILISCFFVALYLICMVLVVYSDRVNPSARTNCTTFTKKQNRFHGRCASPISFILQIFLFQSVN